MKSGLKNKGEKRTCGNCGDGTGYAYHDRYVQFSDGDLMDGSFTNNEPDAKHVWKCRCCGHITPRKFSRRNKEV